MAVLGHVAGGFLVLAAGLRSARAAGGAGEAWGQEAARRYQEAMDDYAERYGLKSTGQGPSLWQVPQPEGRADQGEDELC